MLMQLILRIGRSQVNKHAVSHQMARRGMRGECDACIEWHVCLMQTQQQQEFWKLSVGLAAAAAATAAAPPLPAHCAPSSTEAPTKLPVCRASCPWQNSGIASLMEAWVDRKRALCCRSCAQMTCLGRT